MSRYSKVIAGGALSLAFGGALHAQGATQGQTVAFEVQSINQISVAGSPSLVINTAVPGSQPTFVTDVTGSYSITTNEASRKITIQLDFVMPHDVTLTATLAAPSGGSSAGPLVLTTSAQDAVTAIAQVIGSGIGITYRLDATVAAGVVASTSRTVVLTIVAGP